MIALRGGAPGLRGRIRRKGSVGATKWGVEQQYYAATKDGEAFEEKSRCSS